jgi:hypothetical protein
LTLNIGIGEKIAAIVFEFLSTAHSIKIDMATGVIEDA